MKKTNRSTIRVRKKRYCTVFSEFPTFPVHLDFRLFPNRHIIALFGERSPIYNITPIPHRYSPKRDILRRRPSVHRRFLGCRQGEGIPALAQQIPANPARTPDPRIFLPKPVWPPGMRPPRICTIRSISFSSILSLKIHRISAQILMAKGMIRSVRYPV